MDDGKIKYKTKIIPLSKYQEEVESRGEMKEIKFRCPVCGNAQSINDFIETQMPEIFFLQKKV